MPVPSPFHPRTAELCTSLRWKDWAGYFAVCSYGATHEREYYALRHAVGMIDVTPLFKYDVSGPDAARLLSFVTVRDIGKLKLEQSTYLCWCDDDGKVLDDGTVTRLGEERFRMTSAEPYFHWLADQAEGLDVRLEDVTEKVAALAVQGPSSRALLASVVDGDVTGLRFFRALRGRVRDFECVVTRTGYTGDLGYEIWVENEHALDLWDALTVGGRAHGLLPAGLDALDVTRIEAGFILAGVDYFPARGAAIESRKASPFELGLDWTVKLEREPFIGQAALLAERARGSPRATVGLVLDWQELEAMYEAEGLPPDLPSAAWRGGVPVYSGARHVGRATSGAWSPTLKKYLAIALVESESAAAGTRLEMEVLVEFKRRRVTATVTERPFFDPPRKRETPEALAAAPRGEGTA
jgi:aminomethyltransferase